jgi:hypothetical protein
MRALRRIMNIQGSWNFKLHTFLALALGGSEWPASHQGIEALVSVV